MTTDDVGGGLDEAAVEGAAGDDDNEAAPVSDLKNPATELPAEVGAEGSV